MFCAEDPDAWKGEPATWFELIFGAGYVALEAEIDREIGPEYRMYLEILDSDPR